MKIFEPNGSRELIEKTNQISNSHIYGAIYGIAIGDALGVPYEFKSREQMLENPCVEMVGQGTHKMPKGTWSDDTSMTLATLVGISKMKHDGDYSAIMREFLAWLNGGKYTIDRVFDIGGTCSDAILNFSQGISPLKCGARGERNNGNGSLMRIMPAVLYSLFKHQCVDTDIVKNIGALTHAHRTSIDACMLYGELVRYMTVAKEPTLQGDLDENKQEVFELYRHLLRHYGDNAAKMFYRLGQREFYDLPESEIESSGYVVDTLEAALWCFANTNNYKDCVLKAVNLGGDTDTVAAVAGGLAGLFYGIDNIPKEWIEMLRGKDIIDSAIDGFVKILT